MALKSNIQKSFSCPIDFTPNQRVVLGNLIMEKIRERCDSGLRATGGNMPSYSAEYQASLDFKNAGKSNVPNLQLSGDMLATMSIVRHSIGTVVIGYEIDDDIAGQVEGNQIGSYGNKFGNPAKARPFLGLPDGVMRALISQSRNSRSEVIDSKSSKAIQDILNGLSNKMGE